MCVHTSIMIIEYTFQCFSQQLYLIKSSECRNLPDVSGTLSHLQHAAVSSTLTESVKFTVLTV